MRCIQFSQSDVVFHSVLKQIHLLKYHTDIRHQLGIVDLADISTADPDRACIHIPEPGDQLTKCRLARTGRTDHRGR